MDKQTNPTLSIIIVNYNVKEELVNCIESIEHSIGSDKNPVSYEVIVSDNGSIDGSVEAVREKFPWVKIIENKANLGFGKANNIGAQYAKGEVLFFLNPDTIIIQGISEMVRFLLDHPEVGLLGPVILDQNQKETTYSPAPVFISLFVQIADLLLTPIVRFFFSYQKKIVSDCIRHNLPCKVKLIHGCAMMMRKETFIKISGFNELLFMYGEEMEMSVKMKRYSYKVIIHPEGRIIHLGGRSSNKNLANIRSTITGARALKLLLKLLFPYTWSIRYRIEMLTQMRQIISSYINHRIMHMLGSHDDKHFIMMKKHINILKALSSVLHENTP
ncbi:MAG: glycosyltransferase family 2 protein [bacterium]